MDSTGQMIDFSRRYRITCHDAFATGATVDHWIEFPSEQSIHTDEYQEGMRNMECYTIEGNELDMRMIYHQTLDGETRYLRYMDHRDEWATISIIEIFSEGESLEWKKYKTELYLEMMESLESADRETGNWGRYMMN